jgi:hypothetical protein
LVPKTAEMALVSRFNILIIIYQLLKSGNGRAKIMQKLAWFSDLLQADSLIGLAS